MSSTVSAPVEVPRETIAAWCRNIGFPDATEIAIRRATEMGILKLIEVEPCKTAKV
ncbi:MAG: hypothetical protein M0Q92_11815 [Methanoregula sp.]|jgi:hypothetical protein|nr:hypothetical protein [Methanoregula sp.]